MILVIDNYDSFSYNLVQMLGEILEGKTGEKGTQNLSEALREGYETEVKGLEIAEGFDRSSENNQIRVIRNDELTTKEIEQLKPTHIILSPGPGRPSDAGICEDVILKLAGKAKILGVCLGHQAICETFGATITYAKRLMHGKQSKIQVNTKCRLFQGLEGSEIVGRYHSLVAKPSTIPSVLEVVAVDGVEEVMAVQHKDYEIYGLQFHPESVLTPHGKQMLENFLQ